MERDEYTRIFELAAEHWWYEGLLHLVRSQVELLTNGDRLQILDAGCGTGWLLRGLRPARAFGVDASALALGYARHHSSRLARARVGEIPFRDASFNVVVCLDVLYHLEVTDDRRALAEIRRVLRPGGSLLLNLPAFEGLRSRHDAAVHTRHRYRRAEVKAMLTDAGFSIGTLTYWNFVLFPLAAAMRLAGRLSDSRSAPRSDLTALRPTLNRILRALLRAENRWLLAGHRLPWGLSVFAVAQRV